MLVSEAMRIWICDEDKVDHHDVVAEEEGRISHWIFADRHWAYDSNICIKSEERLQLNELFGSSASNRRR